MVVEPFAVRSVELKFGRRIQSEIVVIGMNQNYVVGMKKKSKLLLMLQFNKGNFN